MLKIALVQFNPIIADLDGNTNKIISYIREARSIGCNLVVFPELSITGYPPLDFLYINDFLDRCDQSIEKICDAAQGISVIVGAPVRNPSTEGKDLYNAALYIHNGNVSKKIYKTLLPNYDVFDEYRWFEPNNQFDLIDCHGVKVALTICEDLWNLTSNPMYIKTPMDELISLGPELMINIAASPFSCSHPGVRHGILNENIHKYQLPLLYVNQCGAQTELVFDGNSQVLNPNGKVYTFPSFTETVEYFNYSNGEVTPLNTSRKVYTDNSEFCEEDLMEWALITGIRDYFKKSGFQKAILGLSGGVDSALVTVLAVKALGAENVYPVLMPSRYSSDHSIADSLELIENLGIPKYDIIPIEAVFQAVTQTLEPAFLGKSADLTEENIQSRIRGLYVMALSNKHGYILLNTSNKSELAVGYGTLYGDMCGGLSVIGDLYKTMVYRLCRWINRAGEVIPERILTKPPSAELRPDQKDSDSLPEYELLDAILESYIENNVSARELVSKGFDESLVTRVFRLVNLNEYKRKQTPPILRVTVRAFGPGRRMPIVAKY